MTRLGPAWQDGVWERGIGEVRSDMAGFVSHGGFGGWRTGSGVVGFVWYGGFGGGRPAGAKAGEGGDTTVVDEVETSLVAVQEGDARVRGEAGDGCSHGIEDFLADMGLDFLVEQMGLEGPRSAQAPGGSDHFFDYVHFDIVNGLEAFDVLLQVHLKAFGIFVLEDDGGGQEAVAERVLRGTVFPFGGDRAMGAASIGAGGFDLLFGAHVSYRYQDKTGWVGEDAEVIWNQ